MSEKVLHEWTSGGWLFQVSEDGRYVRSCKAAPLDVPTGWCPWTTPLTADQAEIARLAAENERLRVVADAARRFMRCNGSGKCSVYDAAKAYEYGEQLNAALVALKEKPSER